MRNYFELYELPVSFAPDQALVKKKYYALSKKYHPDFYANESESVQEEVLNLSTENTKAYQILSNPAKIIEYVLQLKEVLQEGEQYALPQEFLMEMMEVNEQLMDLQFDPNPSILEKVKREITVFEESLNRELNQLISGFETLDNDHQQVKLVKIKDLYYRAKYLARLKETVGKMD